MTLCWSASVARQLEGVVANRQLCRPLRRSRRPGLHHRDDLPEDRASLTELDDQLAQIAMSTPRASRRGPC
jgi:hypothetical protein